MTRDRVFALAKQVGMTGMIPDVFTTVSELEKFDALVYAEGQAAERDACADLVRQLRQSIREVSVEACAMKEALDQAEIEIRSRGAKEWAL